MAPTEKRTRIDVRSVIAAVSAVISIGIAFIYLCSASTQKQADSPQGWVVAKLVRSGQIDRIYDSAAHAQYAAITGQHTIYNRPAFHALMLWPLSFLSYGAYLFVVRSAILGLYTILLWKLPSWFPGVPLARTWLASFGPFLVPYFRGQDTLAVTLIVAYSLRLILRDQNVKGGALLGLASFKPHDFWLLPIVFLVLRRWKALGGFVMVAMPLWVLSALLIGRDGIEQWLEVLRGPATFVHVFDMGNPLGLATNFGRAVGYATGTLAIFFFLASFRKRDFTRSIAAALLASAFLSPHSYVQDYGPSAIAALVAPHPALAYFALVPWPLAVFRDPDSAVPFAFIALVLLAGLAFWPSRQVQPSPPRECSVQCGRPEAS